MASLPPVFFAGDVEILRGDLAEVLYQATMDDTEYIFGDSVTSLTQDHDGVHVTFEHAAPRSFSLVIGADGVHSNIRRLAFGPEDGFARGLGVYASIFTTPNFAGLDRAGLLYSTPARPPACSPRAAWIAPSPSCTSPRRRCVSTRATPPGSGR